MKRVVAAMLIVGLAGFGSGFVAGFQLGKAPDPPPTVQIVPVYPAPAATTTSNSPT